MGIYGNIGAFNGLGKPTIKLEFDNNEALLDFQRRMQNAGDAESYNNATWYDIPSTPETVPAVVDGLGTPGDTYIITDTRKRARKDLEDTAALKKYDIRKFSGEELQKMQTDDPLLYEQIKSDLQQQKTPIKQEVKTKEYWMQEVDKMLEAWKNEAFNKTTPQKFDEPASSVKARYISNLRNEIIKYFIEEIDKGNYERVSNIANILGYKYAYNERIAQTNGLISQFVGIVPTLPEGWRISKNIPKWLPKLPKGFIYIDNGKEMFDYRHKIMPTKKDLGDLEGYGDKYTVIDNRKRAKKEPGELVANKNLLFTKEVSNNITNYNHTVINNPDYKEITILFQSQQYETHFPFFHVTKKARKETHSTQTGKDGQLYDGHIIYIKVPVDVEKLYNLDRNSHTAYISLSYYKDLKNKAFKQFLQSWQNTFNNYKEQIKKIKTNTFLNASTKESWIKEQKEYLNDALKVYKYNCDFYGIENDSEKNFALGKTANNALYNDNSIIDCRGLKPTYTILSDYTAFFDDAKQNTSFAGFGLDDTLKLIADTCRKHYKECSKIAAHLKGDCKLQSAFNLWHWLRHNIRYEYDREGREEVRAPLRTWADRARGVDCDCLSVFAWCVLKCMGYDPVFELVAFRNKPQFSHIFVNLDGIVVDRVWFIFNSRPPLVTKNKIYKVDLFNSLGKLF